MQNQKSNPGLIPKLPVLTTTFVFVPFSSLFERVIKSDHTFYQKTVIVVVLNGLPCNIYFQNLHQLKTFDYTEELSISDNIICCHFDYWKVQNPNRKSTIESIMAYRPYMSFPLLHCFYNQVFFLTVILFLFFIIM